MSERKKGGKEAQSELMKMLANKDDKHVNKLKKRVALQKHKNSVSESIAPVKKKSSTLGIVKELQDLPSAVAHGVKDEWESIKNLITKGIVKKRPKK